MFMVDDRYKPLLDRVSRRLAGHFFNGWFPPAIWHEPLLWKPRCHNKAADALADFTMDRRKSWNRRFPTNLCPSQANIIVQTDGGLRPGDCAAAAFVIGLWSQAGKYEPWFAQGTFLHSSCMVFASEAIALDEASEKLELFLRDVVQTQSRLVFSEHRTVDSYGRRHVQQQQLCNDRYHHKNKTVSMMIDSIINKTIFHDDRYHHQNKILL